MTEIKNMSVEYRIEPLAVEASKPRFSWNLSSDRRGCRQTAYRIRVTADETDVWDSGCVESDRMLNIPYAGKELAPESDCVWSVTVRDELGDISEASSFFRTSPKSWHGAKWIGSDKLMLSAHTLSVFKLSYTVRILPGSTKAGFLFGGNDSRLMDRNKNIQGVQNVKDESYINLTLDISAAETGGEAVFSAYRHGYAPEDGPQPLHQAVIPRSLINEANCHDEHTILIKCVFGEICVYIDGEENWINEGERHGRMPSSGWNLNPVGKGNNYICFPLLCDIGVKMDQRQEAVFSNLAIRHFRKPNGTLLNKWPEAIAGGGSDITVRGGESGYLSLADPSHDGLTMLRTEFNIAKPVKHAYLYATARGIYEIFLNGERVGDDWFAPGLSQYNKTHFYQAYDVTALLKNGGNAVGAYLAEGWWSGAITFAGENWNFFGDRQSLLLRLAVTYEDGTSDNIVSSPETWRYTMDGPVRAGSFFQGEIYDSFKEMPGWDTCGFDASGWKPAKEVMLSEDNAFMGEVISGPARRRSIHNYDSFTLRPQPDEGVKMVARLTAAGMTEPRPGVYIYDMGQNMAGVPEIDVNGTAGQTVTLRYAEILYPDMEEYSAHTGMLMLENIRAALAQDKFILKEGAQTICPRFTQHGYRYIEITGISSPLPLNAVRGLSLSSVNLTSSFSCSDHEIDRLYQNVCWSLRDNFISIPTDCPQRNERMGWSGDISVFSRTASYMSDCAAFLRRHMQAMRDMQSSEGRFDDVSPVGGGFGGTLWGSAGITVAWESYCQFGDLDMLKEHFPSMCRYVRYLGTCLDHASGIVNEGPLGDWLGPENSKNEPAYLWQCYYIYDLAIIIRAADILGLEAEKQEFGPVLKSAKAALMRTYFDTETGITVFSSPDATKGSGMPFMRVERPLPEPLPSGRYPMDTQTSYAVPLALGILDGDQAQSAREKLINAVERRNTDDLGVSRPPYSLMTGFVGTALICPALSMVGADAEAWRLLRQTEYPSWLYPVRQGATSIWERLDSFTLERGFGGNNSMNSFNHYSFGAVGYWMLSRVLGIARSADIGNWELAPMPDPDGCVTWAEGSVTTPSGVFRSSWKIGKNGIEYTFTVPANENALLKLPAAEGAVILEGGNPAENAPGVTELVCGEGCRKYRLASGEYTFLVKS